MGYLEQASAGMLWQSLSTIVARASSFLSLIVLGWYLSAEEFALYALAYSSSSVFMALRNGGVEKILMQRGARSYEVAINLYVRYAIFFNVLAMALIFIVSPLVVNAYQDNILYALLTLLAISLPLGTAGFFYRTKLVVDLRFSDVAKFDAYSSILRHASASVLAISGFGVISFMLPLVFVAVFEGVYGRYKSNVVLLKDNTPPKYAYKRILFYSRWMIISSIATLLVHNGGYLIIGLLENKESLGLYFFGFQLTLAIGIVVTQNIQSVLLPIMSKMRCDIERQSEAYKKMIILMTLIVTPLLFLMSYLSEYFVDSIWDGKWNDAIPIVQLMSLSLVTIVLIPIGRSILESRAQWKVVAYLMILDAIGTVLSVLIGSLVGGLLAIAVSVSLYRFFYGAMYVLYVASQLKMKIAFFVKLILVAMFSAIMAWMIMRHMGNGVAIQSIWLKMLFEISVYMVFYASISFLLQHENYFITKKYLSAFLSKKA